MGPRMTTDDTSLRRLTYVSIRNPGVSDAAVADMVAWARQRNADAGVTGVLLFNGLNFLQTMEGPFDAIGPLFGRVDADPLHAGVTIVADGVATARLFSGWDMALFDTRQPAPGKTSAPAIDASSFELPAAVPEDLRQFYRGFAGLAG
jgi:Sensors of blue-light using FAD